MASETIKALLMIALFGVLEAALYLPRMSESRLLKRLRQMKVLHRPHWPAHTPIIYYALVPVRGRRHGYRR